MIRFIKVFSLVLFSAMFLSACSAQRGSTDSPLSAWRAAVKGQWTLNTVEKENFPTSASVKSIFDEAPIECFIGSNWDLTGSGKGYITFSESGSMCAPGSVREIFWSVVKEEATGSVRFQFKKILPGDRAKDVTTGYQLDLQSVGNGNMVMRMPLEMGNPTAGYLIFNFSN